MTSCIESKALLLSTKLASSGVALAQKAGWRAVAAVYDAALTECLAYLRHRASPATMQVNPMDPAVLMSTFQSVLRPKVVARLRRDEDGHVSRMVVTAFVKSLQTMRAREQTHRYQARQEQQGGEAAARVNQKYALEASVSLCSVVGVSAMSTKLYDGMLVQLHEGEARFLTPAKPKGSQPHDRMGTGKPTPSAASLPPPGSTPPDAATTAATTSSETAVARPHRSVAMFTESLAGDAISWLPPKAVIKRSVPTTHCSAASSRQDGGGDRDGSGNSGKPLVDVACGSGGGGTASDNDSFSDARCTTGVYNDAAAATEAANNDDAVLKVAALRRLEELCSRLCDADVSLLICQRVVHPTLREMLWIRGIATLHRLGHKEMQKLLLGAGATPLRLESTIRAPINPVHLGYLAPPTLVKVHRTRFVQLVPGRRGENDGSRSMDGDAAGGLNVCTTTTVMLVGRDYHAALELEAAAKAGIRAMAALFACPQVCAGAGATEALLSSHLRAWAAAKVPAPFDYYNAYSKKTASSSSTANGSDGRITMLEELIYDEELPCTAQIARQCVAAFCKALESTYDAPLEQGASVAEVIASSTTGSSAAPATFAPTPAPAPAPSPPSATTDDTEDHDPLAHYRHPWQCQCRSIGWDPCRQQTTCVLRCSARPSLPVVDGFNAKCSALVVAVGAANTLVRTGTVVTPL